LDAEVEIWGAQGVRRLLLADLIEGPGRTGLQPGEILAALRFVAPGGRSLFIKVGRRNALNISRLSVSVAGRLDEAGRMADVRLVPGAAIPRTRRITEVESWLRGQIPATALFEEAGVRMAAVMVAEAGRRWSTPYKEPVLAALTRRALAQVFGLEPAMELPEFLADLHLPVQHPGRVHPPDSETRVHPHVRHEGTPQSVHFQLNGAAVTASVPVGLSLLTVLRETFGLLGVKVGCNGGECGACTVLLDGEPVLACLMLAHQAEGRAVVTVEGLQGPDGGLSDLQQAFIDHGAVQCGFCIPGMLLSAEALLERDWEPTREEIRYAIAGNLCRCTGYQQIVDAIEATAQERRKNLF
jgi:carbon-monoxide dehydrogenase small subunit